MSKAYRDASAAPARIHLRCNEKIHAVPADRVMSCRVECDGE